MKNLEHGFVSILVTLIVLGVVSIGSYMVIKKPTVIPVLSDIFPSAFPSGSDISTKGHVVVDELNDLGQVNVQVQTGIQAQNNFASGTGIRGKVLLYESSGVDCPDSSKPCAGLSLKGPASNLLISITPSLDGGRTQLDRARARLIKTNQNGELEISLEAGLYYVSDEVEINGSSQNEARVKGQWVEVKSGQMVSIDIVAIVQGV